MNLRKKKVLASKVLGVGKSRIIFDTSALTEISEVVTKQDIRGLYEEGLIKILPIKGRKKVEKRKRKRSFGKIKKKVNRRKTEYVLLTRKLRRYIAFLKSGGLIPRELYRDLRKKIRSKTFRSKAHLKEHIKSSAMPLEAGTNMKSSKVKANRKGGKRK